MIIAFYGYPDQALQVVKEQVCRLPSNIKITVEIKTGSSRAKPAHKNRRTPK